MLNVPDLDRLPMHRWVLGCLPIAPLVMAAVLIWLVSPLWQAVIAAGTIYWSAILFFFLAGVRYGLALFTVEGPQPAQWLTTWLLFLLGVVVFVMPYAGLALILSGLGFAGLGVIDPRAARRGEVPVWFRVLRPPQMGLAAASIVAVLLALLF